jgi:hypothetical protein
MYLRCDMAWAACKAAVLALHGVVNLSGLPVQEHLTWCVHNNACTTMRAYIRQSRSQDQRFTTLSLQLVPNFHTAMRMRQMQHRSV